jgi:hypothetical protein
MRLRYFGIPALRPTAGSGEVGVRDGRAVPQEGDAVLVAARGRLVLVREAVAVPAGAAVHRVPCAACAAIWSPSPNAYVWRGGRR